MMMLKEEQIQFEKYIDKVIKKIKIIKSGPVKTLNCLLQDYLHENSCRFSFSVPIPNHSIFDISLAKILVKRLDSLCDISKIEWFGMGTENENRQLFS